MTKRTGEARDAPARPSRRALAWIIGLGVAGAAAGVLLMMLTLPDWLVSQPSSSTQAPAAIAPAGETRRIHATLFYVAETGDILVPADLEVPYADSPAEQARRIVEAQLQAPPAGQVSAIPAGVRVRAVYLTPIGEAFVDLSREMTTGQAGGSLDELLAIYAIVNAITVNLPDITAVQLLVEGQEVDTIAGHVDVRHPLRRSARWIRKDT